MTVAAVPPSISLMLPVRGDFAGESFLRDGAAATVRIMVVSGAEQVVSAVEYADRVAPDRGPIVNLLLELRGAPVARQSGPTENTA